MSVVLIAGSSGFVGKHLARHLKNNQHQVIGLDFVEPGPIENISKDSMAAWCEKFGLDGFIKYRLGEFNEELQRPILEKLQGVTAVVNLLAQSEQRFITNPKQCMSDMIDGTAELFHLTAHMPNLERVVNLSDGEILSPLKNSSAKEDGSLKCSKLYHVAKSAQEMLVQVYAERKVPVLNLRSVKIFGPDQSYDGLIPRLICDAIRGQHVHVENEIHQWLPVDYICDVLNWAILNNYIPAGTTVHISAQTEISNDVLAFVISRTFNRDALALINQGSSITRYSIDPGEAHLVWDMPKYTGLLTKDLFQTFDWYKQNFNKELMSGNSNG